MIKLFAAKEDYTLLIRRIRKISKDKVKLKFNSEIWQG